jgi:hypothetical protein
VNNSFSKKAVRKKYCMGTNADHKSATQLIYSSGNSEAGI